MLKIGGSVGAETDAALDAAVALNDGGHSLVVVHGGGPAVGEWAERLGMDTRFVRGLRVTDPDTRDLALAILGGLTNGRVVATLSHGRSSWASQTQRVLSQRGHFTVPSVLT